MTRIPARPASARAPWMVPTLALLLLAGSAIPPARAATVVTPNACRYSIDASWHDQGLTYDVTATPNPAAPGASFSVGGTARTDLPALMTQLGFNLGLLKAGENRVPARAWIAVAGPGSAQGVQVRQIPVEFVTTIQTNAAGGFQDGTPLTVTVPLPASAWTAPQAGTVALRQAGAGTLPPIPGSLAPPPLGSFYIEGSLGFFGFQLDCQPGAARPDGSGPLPQDAQAVEIVTIDAAAPAVAPEPPPAVAPPAPPPAAPPPGVTVAAAPRPLVVVSPALTLVGGTVRLTLRCLTARPCRGTVAVRSYRRLRSRPGLLTVARRPVTLAPGRRATVVLSLTPDARRLMRTRRALVVRVVATPAAGSPVSRRISLRRS